MPRISQAIIGALSLAPRKKTRLNNRLSLVVACYNVEKYVDDFFSSVFSQNVNLHGVEIIAVDDGSTDATASRIHVWQRRYPESVRYIRQSNQKQAAARNTGLTLARGDWVTFPDPDDVLAPDYFLHVDEEISRFRATELSMVCCNFTYKKERPRLNQKPHWLSYRFGPTRTVLPASDLGDYIQIATNSTWFRRRLIDEHMLRYDPRVVPNFEDGHFANRFLLLNPDTEVVFLKEAVYHYRKRADGTSTIDQAKGRPSWCLDSLRYGYLDLLNQATHIRGSVPRFIQRTVLYDLLFRFDRLVDHPELVPLASSVQRDEFFELLINIFAAMDVTTVEEFELGPWTEIHKVGLLALMKNVRPRLTKVFLRQYDHHKGLMQFSYLSANPNIEVVGEVNREKVTPRFVSRQRSTFLDRDYAFEHFFWFSLGPADELKIIVEQQLCEVVRSDASSLGASASFAELKHAFDSQHTTRQASPLTAIGLFQWLASTRYVEARYADCWLFIDRPGKADDNAEHLYRYLLSTGIEAKIFFVLKRGSPDWQRLKAEGFKLIALGSVAHGIALRNAKFLVSSQLDEFKQWPGKLRDVDICTYRLVFVEHGVIKDDISRWLNTKPIALMLTTTKAEYGSIIDPKSNYRMSEKEVALTGLPRHDRLLSLTKSQTTLLVMPTWRKFLFNKKRQPIAGFAQSAYVRHWCSILNSPEFRKQIEERELKVTFCPHAAVAPFVDCFSLPDYIEVIDQLFVPSLHTLFARTALLLTDYSSVAFELAYIERPVIYYQFDAGEFYSGTHLGFNGYFDFEKDGFGPVCQNEDALHGAIEATLSGEEHPVYAERRRNVFPYRDGRCCKRAYEAILELDAPFEDTFSTFKLGCNEGARRPNPEASHSARPII